MGSGAAKWRQFILLLWKNFILQKRRPIATFVELALPLLFAALLVIIRTTVDTTTHPNITTWREFSVNNLPNFKTNVVPKDGVWTVAYAPNNDSAVENIMANFETFLKHGKSDLEINCPGLSFVKNMGSPDEDADVGSGMGGPPPGAGAGAGDLTGARAAFSMFTSAVGGGTMTRSMSAIAAPMFYQNIPQIMKDIIIERAADAGKENIEYVSDMLVELGPEEFMKDVTEELVNKTMECVFDELDPRFREFFEENKSNVSSLDTDGSSDNSTEKRQGGNSSSGMMAAIGAIPKIQVMGFEDEASFMEYVTNDTNLAGTLGGIIFTKSENTSTPKFSYKIRLHSDPVNVGPGDDSRITGNPDTWRTTQLFPGFQRPGPRDGNDRYGGKPGYYKEGFLSLMHAVDMAILATVGDENIVDLADGNFRMKRFPYPPYVEDNFLVAISQLLPLLIMLSFLYTALTIVKSVVHEKESKLKEYLMMTGLPNWLHWLAWFIKYLVFLTISCMFFTILFKINTPNGKVFTYTDGTVLFVFLVCYCAATICFCFMISVFFSKANVAAAAGGVLFGLSYMPYLFIAPRYEQMTFTQKSLSSLLSNIAMANGATILSMYEGKGTGVQWSNIADTVTVDDNFTFLQAMFFLIIDAILYMTIAWYVEGVRPGEYGIPKKWNFPFTKSYWCGPPKKVNVYEAVAGGGSSQVLQPSNGINGIEKGDADDEYFEPEAPDQRHIVQIFNLRKVFNAGQPKEKIAVHGLNLTMYEGQITVLLGHNGAGKTTTMSMLTGLFPPSSGNAVVLGHDITTDIELARTSMGLCPQHDILFDELTVDEHIYFFSMIKGLSSEEAKKECDKMAEVLELMDKREARSCTLSGGMKRKLSVGIALCAGSKFIVLDEPTAGMDPAARRAIWDVIQKYRDQCSMLLSTHFMDEADLLGDRIAIMAEGRIRCAGSAVFLKNKFGVGYHVVLNKTPECQVEKVSDFFQSHVPDSRMERTAGAEASFLLPFESSSLFPTLFTELDKAMNELGVLSYGASITTLEEVFLCVTEDVAQPVAVASRRLSLTGAEEDHKTPASPTMSSADILQPPDVPNTGTALWFQQFHGLLVKRILHSRRHLKVLISQLLVPVVFVILAIINAKYAPFLETNKELDLSLFGYGNTTVSYNGSTDIQKLTDIYAQQFTDLADAVNIQGDLEMHLSNEYKKQGGSFNNKNIISGTVRDNKSPLNSTVAWFNAQGWHSSANTLLYADQAYIRWKLNNTGFDLDVSNHPLPRNSSARVQEQLVGSIAGFMIAFNVVLGFSFLAASFSIFIVRERTDRASLLQTLAGVDPICFWLSGFLWDFINFLIPCLICMIVFAIFGVEEFLHNGQFAITLLLFALYCWAALPLTYLMSLLFSLPTTALVTITIFGDIMGLATIITINVLMLIDDNTRDVAKILDWVFLILPQYSIGQGLADLYTNDKMVNVCTTDAMMEAICEEYGITFQTNFLAWERYGVGRFVVFMFLEGLLFFGILFAIEYDIEGVFLRLSRSLRKKVTAAIMYGTESTILDDDVSNEQNRINDTLLPELKKSELIFAKNLRRVYAGKKGGGVSRIIAVDNLNLGVPKGECFGLLGINGAGKTTTFKMLTGDVRPTAGTAYVNGHDIISNRKQAQQKIGYCPQFDGLIQQMTGRETLVMYARLRGVKEKYIQDIVEKLAKLLHFKEHIDKECGTYSGGNKRKLSTAIALVGGPSVVLLDEPSTGLDPGARRKLWDTITQICTDKRCIIITSHSMEECEALCTRLAIMVNGQMRCLGGPQHLKNKFGQGYSVEVKLESNNSDPDPIKAYMQSHFPGTIIKDEHQGLVAFQVPKIKPSGEDLSLATIFSRMEETKAEINLRDYSVSQTTLEQVFLSFARRQRETTDQ
ncbi:phospholipid-transporting ATPase ABCA3-like isoform X1 [Styela clava]